MKSYKWFSFVVGFEYKRVHACTIVLRRCGCGTPFCSLFPNARGSWTPRVDDEMTSCSSSVRAKDSTVLQHAQRALL